MTCVATRSYLKNGGFSIVSVSVNFTSPCSMKRPNDSRILARKPSSN